MSSHETAVVAGSTGTPKAPARTESLPHPEEENWTKTHHVSHSHAYSSLGPQYLSGERAYSTEGMGGRGTQGAASYKAASAAGVNGMGASSATGKYMGQETSGMAGYNQSEVKGMDGPGSD